MTGTFTVNGKPVSFTQSSFLASGGEGEVHKIGHYAYKLYHDTSKMIPVGKIQELSTLKYPNILGPQDIVYKGNNPVGFVMKYVKDTEFLCKLFTKGFRDRNGISEKTSANLVRIIQDTVKKIHSHNILLVDANEMNFLTSGKFNDVYFIDVDSYQTPSYHATALMESVRDRKVKNKQFTELSDWFSVACVMLQLYIGCHPYKGRHPDFAPKDWPQMMDNGISVFNKKCRLPPACLDFNVIPKGHLKWFESIFEKGERTIPPEPDAIAPIAPVAAKIIRGNDKFNIEEVRKYKGKVKSLRFIDGICWAITNVSIQADNKEFTYFTEEIGYSAGRIIHDLVPCMGDKPVWIEWNRLNGKLTYSTYNNLDKTQIGEITCNGFFVANRCVYTVVNDSLVEISFINSGKKVTPMQQVVANVFHNHQVFDGFIIQNLLGTCRFTIPSESGKCITIRIKELDGARIVDAVYNSGVAIVIAEKNGKYDRYTYVFGKDALNGLECKHSARIENDVELQEVKLVVKDNGVCITTNGDKFEVFADNSKVRLLDSPLNGSEQLVIFKNDTYVVNGDTLYKINSK